MRRKSIELYEKCINISDDELLDIANNIDSTLGCLLFYSIKHGASYETLEREEAKYGRIVPISRNVFYIKRRRYIKRIEQQLADIVASV